MTAPLGGMEVGDFLRQYWQKKPLLIRSAFPGFQPELVGDDLAGLACEPMAESRIVLGSYPEHDWELRHGPFDEEVFGELPETHWTLLVQDVEKHYPPLAELMERFDFLPGWRLDDLMISYAAPGGSVGPHVDQYDVFLLQADGRRRWQIAERYDPALLPGCDLNVLQAFEPEEEWDLEPGDMLYLPPGIAHHGVALTEGMTWSVGLRAPDAADLLMALGEALADDTVPRYADPDLKAVRSPGEIDARALQRLRELMQGPIDDDTYFAAFAGAFLTRFRLAQEPAPPDKATSTNDVVVHLAHGDLLFRNPWTRLAWIDIRGTALLFAAGASFECSVKLARALCARQSPDLSGIEIDSVDLAALVGLLGAGHFTWQD